MYILSGNDHEIVNSEFVERFRIVEKPDAVLIVASYSDVRPPITLARYRDMEEAEDALIELFRDLYCKEAYFRMPESSYHAAEAEVRDARTKRKGGS
jgi:hypothetical protein